MRKLWADCRGAVTVMVTLLLIPAILITGTAVDLSRIYAAQSILQDANQLAANSVLASYDALLQDLYGLFAVMEAEDLKFDSITDAYIKVAIEGEDWMDRGLGTFQVFYGSSLTPGDVTPAQNLGMTPVLRRQIEDFSKYRAPAIIVKKIMGKLEAFEKVQEDAKVIKTKMDVDDGVEELEKSYKKIYDDVQELNKCVSREDSLMETVSGKARELHDLFSQMKEVRAEYARTVIRYDAAVEVRDGAPDQETWDVADEIVQRIEKEGLALKIQYEDLWGKVQAASSAQDYKKACEDGEKQLEYYQKKLEDLVKHCKEADKKKEELAKKVAQLKEDATSGKCSDELSKGLLETETDEKGNPAPGGLSVIERYEALLSYNIEKLGQDMYDADYQQIADTITIMENAALAEYKLTGFKQVDWEDDFPIEPEESSRLDAVLAASTSFRPAGGPSGEGFVKFQDISTENEKFYNELVSIYGTNDNKAKKDNLKNSITKIFKKAQSIFKALAFQPEGALYLENAENEGVQTTGTDFGSEGDWGDGDTGKNELKDSLDDDFLTKLANLANEAGNKALLLVYDTEMFSDASTPGKDDKDTRDYPQVNMAGVELTMDVNYYFQSELEYLYNGDLSSAEANLKSVAGMILLVRFVFNYIASFTISSVKSVVAAVKSALSWTGPFAVLAGELARLGLAIGESAIDMGRLLTGESVALYKKNSTWQLSISGLVDAAIDEVSESAIDAAFQSPGGSKSDEEDEGLSLSYTDYLRLFLLLVNGDVLAQRTARLIELNVTNYRYEVEANEEKMAGLDRVRLSDAVTDFSITTTVDLRMLFLSMPFAQKGLKGVVPPKTLPISVTDYRGY